MTSALRTLDLEIAGLRLLRQSLETHLGESLKKAVTLTLSLRGRIHVTGIGKSGHIARKLAATLTSTGTPAQFLHPTEASHGDLGVLQPEDLLLALSWSGDTPELLPLIDYARTAAIPLIAITAHPRSVLALAATIILEVPQATEACPDNLAPTTSTTMQLALGDALALAILEARALPNGHYPAAFRALHPGGKLGARLTPASALMHTGDRLPFVRVGTPLSAAIVEMTSKGFGATGVLSPEGALVGIVTDGDLRRSFSKPVDQSELMSRPVEQIMTPRPWTINPDALAPDILSHMNATRITSAFVLVQQTPEATPQGIVHIHDLLRIGL
ncbi:KpsF/GutQ family sugar-phosphate isomerase [Granulicella sibirica]|uniref:Arabinose 5-phosphate isomerase n=1 Tax=Granulicella sibirica TaxID=2479048 RepID=A0A4Q0SXR9_9BACT|nr:KpsF/GutQ family sugar-phosphate isomerase [Granulicella sibirica]RXH55953.1 Arabinose 5-phosphate isomerase [Granulicella sibirica]